MRRTLAQTRQSQVERKMSICERRQGAEIPVQAPGQPRHEFSLSGHAPGLAPAIVPERVVKSRACLPEQSDPVDDGKVAYAVYAATGRASQNCRAHRRFVKENVSDELLLKNVAEGDKAAMHIIFARYRETVFRFIQGIVRNPAIADDLVSQVFLDVWRSAKRFENRSRVSTWLLSIARFKALNSLRGPKHVSVEEGNVVGIADAADTPDVTVDRNKTTAILRACIEKLSPAHREIIDLIYYREKSVAEVCELIGIPYATVKSRIFYARKQLARVFVSVGFEFEAIQESVRKRSTGIDRELHSHRSSRARPIREREATCLP
jgi:RNA polymerase sigma-70 factor (ECF subfamily)